MKSKQKNPDLILKKRRAAVALIAATSGSVVSEVDYEYNDFQQSTDETQTHD